MKFFALGRLRGLTAITIAWAILVVGVTGSLVAAVAWHNDVQSRAATSFDSTSHRAAATVRSMLQRDTDFTSAMSSSVGSRPDMTNAEFQRWYDGVAGNTRYPGGAGYAYVERVSDFWLPKFAATMATDPLNGAPAPIRYTVNPPGQRPEYCLTRLAVSVGTKGSGLVSNSTLNGLDLCQPVLLGGPSTIATLFNSARDRGQLTATNIGIPGISLLMLAPVYQEGVVPDTLEARRSSLLGWIMASFDGDAIIGTVLTGQTDLSVTLARQDPGLPAVTIATGGSSPADVGLTSSSLPITADGAWVLNVVGSAEPVGPSSTTQALWLAIAGMAITVLLFFVVRLLVGSRRRAYDLVEERTSQLHHQALHDDLTGLPNRSLVLDRAEQMLARCRRQNLVPAALFLDLDAFKSVNDSFGHGVGDQLLKEMAERLSATLRASDTAGRLGGDEFVILVEGTAGDAIAEGVAERILDVVRQPFKVEGPLGTTLLITASIGVACGDRASADDLLRDADLALYQAKALGKNRSVTFASSMHTEIQDRLELERDLRSALDLDQLFVLYQPTFGLADSRMTGVEALLRWQHPTRGVISPLDFIPIAEDTGLILPIGRWVLGEACRQAALWQSDGEPFQMSVNVSARQFDTVELVGEVRDALATSGLPPSSLTLEITESVLMHDLEETTRRLHELRALGVRIAIDDFGTGYSSLAYLRRFPVDTLKIDRSFISSIADSPAAGALIHTLVQLGKTLGLETVAEGIEDQVQLERLQRENCDTGQGFLFARPLTAELIDQLLANMRRPQLLAS
jgi:diguanylate cyclase (GGDEF)-like protein